jgi:hypothetical protein
LPSWAAIANKRMNATTTRRMCRRLINIDST